MGHESFDNFGSRLHIVLGLFGRHIQLVAVIAELAVLAEPLNRLSESRWEDPHLDELLREPANDTRVLGVGFLLRQQEAKSTSPLARCSLAARVAGVMSLDQSYADSFTTCVLEEGFVSKTFEVGLAYGNPSEH